MAIDFTALRNTRPRHAWCTTHRGVLAEQRCTRCLRFVCRHCVKRHAFKGGELGTCPVCDGGTRPLLRAEKGTDYGLRAHDWHALFRWPFRGDGKGVLGMGAFVLILLGFPGDFLRMFPRRIGDLPIAPGYFMLLTFVLGYLGALLIHVVATTANDPERELSWPEGHLAAIVGRPFLTSAVCVLYTLLPALILWSLGATFLAVFSLVLAVIVWPVIALGAVVLRSPLVLNPFWMARTIRQLGTDYLRVLALMGQTLLATFLANLLVGGPLHWIAVFVGGFAFFYFALVVARAVGWLYVVHERRLGWFTRERPRPVAYQRRLPERESILGS